MNAQEFKNKLNELKACKDAKEWANGKDLQTVWEKCHRGDWMLWLYRRADNYTLKELTIAKAYCSETVKHLMKDERSLKALQAAFDFGNGLISEHDLYAASDAASSATFDSDGFLNVYAAYAAYAASSATYAASSAASDAASATYTYSASYEAKKNNQQLTADICRKYLPIPKFN